MVPVLFHFDCDANSLDEITNTLQNYLHATLIWAHSGDAQPQRIRPMLKVYDNLPLDISSRNPLVSFEDHLTIKKLQRLDEEDGTLKMDWKELLSDCAHRVYYGSAVSPNGRREEYAETQEYYRGILAQLDPEVPEIFAYKNAQNIFGLSVT